MNTNTIMSELIYILIHSQVKRHKHLSYLFVQKKATVGSHLASLTIMTVNREMVILALSDGKYTNQGCFQSQCPVTPSLYLLLIFSPNPNSNTNVYVSLFVWICISIGPLLGSLKSSALPKIPVLLSGICENESKNLL